MGKRLKPIRALIGLLAFCGSANAQPITYVTLSYTKAQPHPPPVAVVGHKSFVLSLEGDPDVRGRIENLELVLRRRGERPENLLYAPGHIHGYQKFTFAVSDLAGGANKSMFGEQRTISDDKAGFAVTVKILAVRTNGGEFETLTLQVEAR